MHHPLERLIEERDVTKAHLIEVEKAIARHPETIKSAFKHNPMWNMEKFEDIIKNVLFIRKTQSQEPDKWIGYIYQIEDGIYRIKFDKFNNVGECGIINKEETMNPKTVQALWNTDDPVSYLKESEFSEDWRVIGYLLMLSMMEEC